MRTPRTSPKPYGLLCGSNGNEKTVGLDDQTGRFQPCDSTDRMGCPSRPPPVGKQRRGESSQETREGKTVRGHHEGMPLRGKP